MSRAAAQGFRVKCGSSVNGGYSAGEADSFMILQFPESVRLLDPESLDLVD